MVNQDTMEIWWVRLFVKNSYLLSHCGFSSQEAGRVRQHQKMNIEGKPKIWTPCPLWTGFTHSVLICDHHQRRMLGLGNLTAHRALQIGPSCRPGWRNTEEVRRTWRTWKRFKTSTRWLKTLYLWFKTIFCWLKTLYLSTRWLNTLYCTAFMSTVGKS